MDKSYTFTIDKKDLGKPMTIRTVSSKPLPMDMFESVEIVSDGKVIPTKFSYNDQGGIEVVKK